MAELFIPPWLRISATQPGFASNTSASESIFTGAARTTERAGDKVEVTLSTEHANNRETDPNLAILKAIRGALRGHGGRALYTPVGYRPRGEFRNLSVELLSNSTFGSGITGWSASSQTALSATDRSLRVTRTAITANASLAHRASGATTVQYAPYVARAFFAGGSFTFDSLRVALGTTSAASDIAETFSSAFGMAMVSAVVPGTSTFFRTADDLPGTSMLAGRYVDLTYTSLARAGGLVDNGTNLLVRSDEFDDASWTKVRATVSANGSTAPNGTVTGDILVEDATAANSHLVSQAITVSSATGLDFAYAGAFRAENRNWVNLRIQENTGGTSCNAFFNLSTGAKGTVVSSANMTDARSFIRSLGNGWYYCAVVGRKANAATSLSGLICAADQDGTINFNGVNGQFAISMWRATLAQSSVPMRLVQTTTTALPTGALQIGAGLHLKGLPTPTTSGLLLMGDWVQSGKQLCMVLGRLDSDDAGLGYLQLAYPPRVQPPDNDPIIVHEPFGRFYSKESAGGWSESPGGFGSSSFTLCEALDS